MDNVKSIAKTQYKHLKKGMKSVSDVLQSYIGEDGQEFKLRTTTMDNQTDYHFKDGKRRIDFILVYAAKESPEMDRASRTLVNEYLNNLQDLGLQFEVAQAVLNKTITFIKVHCPLKVVYYYAKKYNVNLEKDNANYYIHKRRKKFKLFATILTKPNFDDPIYRRAPATISGVKPNQPTISERILIVNKILNLSEFSDDDNEYGYRTLINGKHLKNAYPMHDGDYQWTETGPLNDRQLLGRYWGSPCMLFKAQPLHLICRYFGPSVGFFFAFVGFYNKMLLLIIIVGILIFCYGVITIDHEVNIKSKLYCKSDIILCARCPRFELCHFSFLNSTCEFSKINHVFDNSVAIAYAIIIAIWATIFFEMWKRYENKLSFRWNVIDVEEHSLNRPQFAENTKYRRTSQFTNKPEPYIPKHIYLAKKFLSASVFLLMAVLVLIILISIIAYRLYIFYSVDRKSILRSTKNRSLFAVATGSLISFIFIIVFEAIFEIVGKLLTDFENPKTDIEYENDLTLKIFVFGFLNGMAPLIYLAFVKGQLYDHPGTAPGGYFNLLRTDLCEIDSCLIDIGTQLAIILIGTSLVRSVIEIASPLFLTSMRWLVGIKKSTKKFSLPDDLYVPQWEQDFYLSSFEKFFLISEYKHVVLQYGYLTMFAGTFPIAPLLGVLYNMIEIRVDSYKMVKLFKRPVPFRVKGIGSWNVIIHIMTLVSVSTNALLIAFSTDFVKREIYIRKNTNLPYLDYMLSVFNTSDYDDWNVQRNRSKFPNLQSCRYYGSRYPPDGEFKYGSTKEQYYLNTMELATFMIIEHFMLSLTAILSYIIPDLPRYIRERMNYLRMQQIKLHEHKILDSDSISQ